MDHERLDDLARMLSSNATRRTLIAALASGCAAMLPVALGGHGSEAKKKKRKRKKRCKCPICQRCRGGSCVSSADDILCNGDGRCLDGQCNPRPTCTSAGFGCDLADPATCCSTVCNPVGPFNAACQPGGAGQECRVDDDCATGTCVGYRCRD